MSQEQTQPNPTPPTSGKQISPDKILFECDAQEEVKHERGFRWYAAFIAVASILLIYFIATRNAMALILFAIIFALALIVTFKDPRTVTVTITYDGIYIDRRTFYPFENIDFFGMMNHPPLGFISLFLNKGFIQYVRVPIGTEDPEAVAEILEHFIPRKDDQEPLIDKMDQILKL
jgi:hypothetical protein